MNLQKLKQEVQGLFGSSQSPLHTYYDFQNSVFMEILSVQMNKSLTLLPFLSVSLVQHQYDNFVLY